MKFIWEEKDIISGLIVCKLRKERIVDLGWRAKWTFKIGWLCGYGLNSINDKDRNNYALVAMTDGMITRNKTKKELIKWLNKEQMIPAPHSHVIEIMNYLENCYKS